MPEPQVPSFKDLEEILEQLIKVERPAILACGEVELPGVEMLKSDKPYVVDLIVSRENIPQFNFRASTFT